jgi:hypothetical protein
MAMWAGLWDWKGDALLLLGLLLVHGLEDFLAVLGYSLYNFSKSKMQCNQPKRRPYSCADGVVAVDGRHGEMIEWDEVQVLLTVEQFSGE